MCLQRNTPFGFSPAEIRKMNIIQAKLIPAVKEAGQPEERKKG